MIIITHYLIRKLHWILDEENIKADVLNDAKEMHNYLISDDKDLLDDKNDECFY